jgi:hypothetical protein
MGELKTATQAKNQNAVASTERVFAKMRTLRESANEQNLDRLGALLASESL